MIDEKNKTILFFKYTINFAVSPGFNLSPLMSIKHTNFINIYIKTKQTKYFLKLNLGLKWKTYNKYNKYNLKKKIL